MKKDDLIRNWTDACNELSRVERSCVKQRMIVAGMFVAFVEAPLIFQFMRLIDEPQLAIIVFLTSLVIGFIAIFSLGNILLGSETKRALSHAKGAVRLAEFALSEARKKGDV